MSFFNNRLWSGVIALCLSATASAAEVWICDFKDGTRRNTIPPKVLVDLRPDGSALVMDPFLVHFEQAPKQAKFVKNTQTKLRVRWRVDDVEFQGGLATDMDFSLVHDKRKSKAFITVSMPSFDNRDSGTGACALRK
ncbi:MULTISPECIES: hypothetical protein [unclassified Epibacterium]|uniref:hypothetical protein n=1 Tax=unclassified Epibacterium TaxID=2639179 RepID=UPI001EF42A0A|nr:MULTISPECIES: hypothetical protein [unclassified Epibacterium]MCG7622435.1 hypothetical protein [Epibacterium sp. Ofav1-8]MCG7628463.1 hypothetical protein [Epibacterium sp. MM17-32]